MDNTQAISREDIHKLIPAEEPLPCPLCGKRAEFWQSEEFWMVGDIEMRHMEVRCVCGLKLQEDGGQYRGKARIIKKWNVRPEIEVLEKCFNRIDDLRTYIGNCWFENSPKLQLEAKERRKHD